MEIVKIADNIVSPLGIGTGVNYSRVKAGLSALRAYNGMFGMDGVFFTSVFEPGFLERSVDGDFSRFEKLAILAVQGAVEGCGIDTTDAGTVLVLSTTKGDLDTPLAVSARKIAAYFGNNSTPIVVSNACISGAAAQIAAMRALRSGRYSTAIVVGADEVSRFTLSGFQCLKALSSEQCHPYSAERNGLNLGEAGACIVYKAVEKASENDWVIENGAIRNDANHISGPSRTGEGSYNALRAVLHGIDAESIAFINAHGTATAYNDEMEAIALSRTPIATTPVNSLKGYYGHTLGAAGIMETILSMAAIDDGIVIGTYGFKSLGVSKQINVSVANLATHKRAFIKLLSGFGGVNAAILLRKRTNGDIPYKAEAERRVTQTVAESPILTPENFKIKEFSISTLGSTYPKYFKMDNLCRLGYVASEMLLKDENGRFEPREDTAVILFCANSSWDNDRKYMRTITPEEFYPSPSLFVYTLPSIVTGEIAIRNKFMGETSMYILEKQDITEMQAIVSEAFQDPVTKRVIWGWVDFKSEEEFYIQLNNEYKRTKTTDYQGFES